MDTAGLFDADVAVAAALVDMCDQPLFPVERAAIANACPSRIAEFRAGRQCAHLALERLGLTATAIAASSARAPCWPAGVVGSISHTDEFAISAVARSQSYAGVGVDVEAAGELDASLVDLICGPVERAGMRMMSPGQARLQAKTIFSIKESVFKCQFPLTGVWLEFTDIEVAIAFDRTSFEAVLLRDAGPLRRGRIVCGRLRETEDYVLSSAWLRDLNMPCCGRRAQQASAA
ncbi:4'-phosphopantetheinyl transferase superfamily protein [Aliihoeflea aestuarii]|jgi:4'-phosphopantetheinyl transferase EntD|nr:4'-phosphopantetheinyl transferase superfamily protein [Aliihoeflea aestuarii]